MIETSHSHLVLLQLIAAEDDQALRLVIPQENLGALLAERSGPAGN
jgi:hypothetical protein